MTCVEFDRLWNEILDARTPGSSESERRLEAHAATCEACRVVSTRYQVLRHAVGSLGPPPVPSADSTAKLLALMGGPRRVPRAILGRRLVRFAWVPLAAAAAALLFVHSAEDGRPTVEAPDPSTIAGRPLDTALADATMASIELAREASAPAARIGLEVLGDLGPAGDSTPAPIGPGLGGLATPPSAVIQSVGERLQASVRPISGSARHAFGFLLGPPPSPAQDRL